MEDWVSYCDKLIDMVWGEIFNCCNSSVPSLLIVCEGGEFILL